MNWNALKYQLKAVRCDKLCIMTFLLPIAVGLALNLLSDLNLSSAAEPSFGILQDDLAPEAAAWLQKHGAVTAYDTLGSLEAAVREPSTQTIGVLSDGSGIRAIRAGDEMTRTAVTADLLPRLYADRGLMARYEVTRLPSAADSDMMKHLLIVITMVTAMFMGCTFNAMNIISEKEDGILSINQVLPLTKARYTLQKLTVGFLGGTISAAVTALICMRLTAGQLVPLLLLILLSAFIAALSGLFIAGFSESLMVGIMYIKLVMILFLAPPILFYLLLPAGGALRALTYLLPSSATFYGLMKLLNGSGSLGNELAVLAAHCAVWFLLYACVSLGRRKSLT